jgi:putative heme-binding domain-containing protein
MAKTGRGHMPHLGSELVDEHGLTLIHEWIRSLSPGATDDSWAARLHSLEQAADAKKERTPQASKAIAELLHSTSDALMLAYAVAQGRVSPATREQVVESAVASTDTVIRDLFERFLPDERRAGRIGNRVKPQEILELRGDRARGKALFFGTATLQCKTCHRIGNEGGRVGPELTAIGKKLSAEQILESIAEPSKTIAQEYRLQVFRLRDGRTAGGIVTSTTDKETVIRDQTDKEIHLPTGDIEQTSPQPQSMMPEGLLHDLTPQQAADLVEYLHSLK